MWQRAAETEKSVSFCSVISIVRSCLHKMAYCLSKNLPVTVIFGYEPFLKNNVPGINAGCQ